MWWWLVFACIGARDVRDEVVHVRGGAIVDGTLIPGATVGRPECVALFSVPLGDVSSLIAAGAEPPDTSLAFSPDGTRLAIGSYTGEIVVVDAFTGDEIARRVLPEAVAKRVAWSPDGAVLYVGEQSPEARLWALDAGTLADRWSVALGDDVGRSPAPDGDDIYGVYQLPGVFGLEITPAGDVIALAVHGWDDGGTHRNASRIVRFGPDGARHAAWPPTGAADATLMTLAYDREGGVLAAPISRSATGPDPVDLPVGAIRVFDAESLTPRVTLPIEPLAPWFSRVFVWQALDVSVAHDRVIAGLGDGRVRIWKLSDAALVADLAVGVPLGTAGAGGSDVPLAASVGFGEIAGGDVLAVTSGTTIPYGAADPALRPPRLHPAENTLLAVSSDGAERWRYAGPYRLSGLATSPDGTTIVAAAGLRDADARTDLFGALVLDRDGRVVTSCPTVAPVFSRMTVRDDGRIAVAEHPWRDGASVVGAYRVTVLR